MAGTPEGGKKASNKIKSKYGEDFFAKIGSRGGKAKVPKGFAKMPLEKRIAAGRKGGKKSKR